MPPLPSPSLARLHLAVRGAVQGVGFRPFVFRLATELRLAGWVTNSTAGVEIEVEGPAERLEEFLVRLPVERPPHSAIHGLEPTWLGAAGLGGFEIRPSDDAGTPATVVMPDLATCPDCVREIFDPANRRFRYPFTNCTHCGPRFSIIEALPYDRANTAMRRFAMCPACRAEYEDPRDRRFHAQPNACPVCGPRLELWRAAQPAAREDAALRAAAAALRAGEIVAVKGLGGFHLLVAAHDEAAVRRLRRRKHREEKPLALMFPNLDLVRQVCACSPLEERLLRSPEAPIVLLTRHAPAAGDERDLGHEADPLGQREQTAASACQHPKLSFQPPASSVAPGNPSLGVMLPYTPLHHLLLAEVGCAVVATSGNLSDEPICTDEREAVRRLAGIADVFLVHNRPIVRHVDDSVVRVLRGRELVLRRARGYAPLPVRLIPSPAPAPLPGRCESSDQSRRDGFHPFSNLLPRQEDQGRGETHPYPVHQEGAVAAANAPVLLAAGAHLKNTVALRRGRDVFLSQHIGDLDNEAAVEAFRRVAADLCRLYEASPAVVVADLHPDYASTQFARRLAEGAMPLAAERAASNRPPPTDRPRLALVQHHFAHVLACMAENQLHPPVLGVAWDGTGYGTDATVWGGEFLLVTEFHALRVAHLRPFRLPGGDAAIKEPRRSALGILYELLGAAAFDRRDLPPVTAFVEGELAVLGAMLVRGVNSPWTSSAGRLFDAVAGLMGLKQVLRFEGQAAMELEFCAANGPAQVTPSDYALRLIPDTGAAALVATRLPEAPAPQARNHTLDWAELIQSVLRDVAAAVPRAAVAARFHEALAQGIVGVARQFGVGQVALSGGCFQNRVLTETAARCLEEAGYRPFLHQRVPPNDGGIALGQVVAVADGWQAPKRRG